jgi:hypothetical protein
LKLIVFGSESVQQTPRQRAIVNVMRVAGNDAPKTVTLYVLPEVLETNERVV